MLAKRPIAPATIKGMFVNSHVDALRKQKGDAAVDELGRRIGRPTRYTAFEAVPIHDEVQIIETALDILNGGALEGSARARAAGALHFKNFSETTLGRTLMHSLGHTPANFKTLLHNTPTIAHVVFSNTTFSCADYEKYIIITITNCDYPIEHFQGFFAEWMRFWGMSEDRVAAKILEPCVYEYHLLIN